MLPARAADSLEQVVTDIVGSAARVEWLPPDGRWSAHALLRGATGLVTHVLELARVARSPLRGASVVEEERGLVGTRSVLVLHADDGDWRIGKRSAEVPV
jgi:hypothetical protein